jgi:hypothetical protein
VDTIDIYRRLNSSYAKKLIFRFGDNAGFFSEFNNLVLAVLYCLDERIRFSLYSPPKGTLSIRQGWNDYFLPFCDQTADGFHRKHNERFLMKRMSSRKKAKRDSLKIKHSFDYYTYELWGEFRSEAFAGKIFDIEDLGIEGDLLSSAKALIDMLWRYNPEFEEMVAKRIAALGLPKEYVGLHIRGGDKITESRLYSPDEYMELVMRNTGMKDIFVLTDDFQFIQELRAKYRGYNFITTCRESESGYDFKAFQRLDKAEQYGEYAKLLASMDVIRNSSLAFGSYKTNPGMFLGMWMGKRFIGIDSEKWLLKW